MTIPGIFILENAPNQWPIWDDFEKYMAAHLTVIYGNLSRTGILIAVTGIKYAHNRSGYVIMRNWLDPDFLYKD